MVQFSIIDKIKYVSKHNSLQKNMIKDIAKIHNTDRITVKSDKTGNLYFYNVADYYKAISKKVNKVYKKAPNKWVNDVNSKA